MDATPPRPSPAAAAPRDGRDAGEVEALLDHLFVRTGLDFRLYARRAVARRLQHILVQEGLPSVAALLARTAAEEDAAAAALATRLCTPVTSLFRDPPFWTALRRDVLPRLRGLPLVRAWSAGCATGEEAFSLAIVFREEGVAGPVRIYATDVDEPALARARAGWLPVSHMPEYTQNYLRGGGTSSLSAYYSAGASAATLVPSIRRDIVFSRHNLATDAPFHAFDLVLCRNVLIYFSPETAAIVLGRLVRALAPGGLLVLGPVDLPLARALELERVEDGGATLLRRPQ